MLTSRPVDFCKSASAALALSSDLLRRLRAAGSLNEARELVERDEVLRDDAVLERVVRDVEARDRLPRDVASWLVALMTPVLGIGDSCAGKPTQA